MGSGRKKCRGQGCKQKQEGTEKYSLKGALISRMITFYLHFLFAGSLDSCKRFDSPQSGLGGYWSEQQSIDRGINIDTDKLAIDLYIYISIYLRGVFI